MVKKLLLLLFFLTLGCQLPEHPRERFPRIILWAWERPEDLRFIDATKIGVAYLAKTIFVRDDNFNVKPRLQPLRVAPGTALMAVLRIESDPRSTPQFSPQTRARLVKEVTDLVKADTIKAVQIDFDARASEREFYRQFITELREALPANYPLSITALASWSIYDNWIDTLPVDEAVPMLFRMGVESREIKHYLATGNDFRSTLCQSSVGISNDELPATIPKGRRLYIFSPTSWSPATLEKTLGKVEKWQ